jgi:hypothetical protein
LWSRRFRVQFEIAHRIDFAAPCGRTSQAFIICKETPLSTTVWIASGPNGSPNRIMLARSHSLIRSVHVGQNLRFWPMHCSLALDFVFELTVWFPVRARSVWRPPVCPSAIRTSEVFSLGGKLWLVGASQSYSPWGLLNMDAPAANAARAWWFSDLTWVGVADCGDFGKYNCYS